MFKKVLTTLSAAFCLQAAQSMSDPTLEIRTCNGWDEIHSAMLDPLSVFGGSAVVILDCDEIMCTTSRGSVEPTSPVLHEVLNELKEREISFFCMTASLATECDTRHGDFTRIGVDSFFQKAPVFSRVWNRPGDNDLPYFVDVNWNTVFTCWPKGLGYTPWCSFNYYYTPSSRRIRQAQIRYERYAKALEDRPLTRTSKGDVLKSLIAQGFLRQPSCVVFVDDDSANIRSMYVACNSLKISYRGLLCETYKPASAV
jgi:hypothetical protein